MGKRTHCPCCGHLTEGTLVENSDSRGFEENLVLKGVKKYVNPGTIIGAKVGTAVIPIPGVGTAIGALVGHVINDMAIDALYDGAKQMLTSYYSFHCEKCGHYWTSEDDYMDNVKPSSTNNDVSSFKLEGMQQQKAFEERQSCFWKNHDSITSSHKAVLEFAKKQTSCPYFPELQMKNNLISAAACLFYASNHKNDKEVITEGLSYIDRAIDLSDGRSGECLMIQTILKIFFLDYSANDIVAQHKLIHKKCPSFASLADAQIIKPEYLRKLYITTRFESLVKTEELLAKKGNYTGRAAVLMMMEELPVPEFQIYADFYLSCCYALGSGVQKSDASAFDYAVSCFERREFNASFEHSFINDLWLINLVNLSDFYTYGKGTDVDYSLAHMYAKKASDLGHPLGKCNLADLYVGGLGVNQDIDFAISLYKSAANSDDENAKEIALEKLAKLEAIEIEDDEYDDNETASENETEEGCIYLTEEEKEYFDELQDCLSDTEELSPATRRLLDSLRKRLGISEERAFELEELLYDEDLTEEEEEYLEEFDACIEEDGTITPQTRRLLDKLAKSLGLSKERVQELEEM